MVQQSLESLIRTLSDSSVTVRDSGSWVVGRIALFHPNTLTPGLVVILPVLLEKLKDSPKVSAKICWVLDSLAKHKEPVQEINGELRSVMEVYFKECVSGLLDISTRHDALEGQLRDSSYNTMATLVKDASVDNLRVVEELAVVLLERLETTFHVPPSSTNPRVADTCELQGSLCGCLQVITHRLGDRVIHIADRLFQCYMRVFQYYQALPLHNNCLHEEALLAVAQLANSLGEHFERFLSPFVPTLLIGLDNHSDVTVCRIACDVVGDLCRALGTRIAPNIESLIQVLYQKLQSRHVDKVLKPNIMVCFGDIAMAVKGELFEKYLSAVTTLLQEAALTRIDQGPDGNEEWLSYLNDLRLGVLQAYTGIIYSFKDCNKLALVQSHVNRILDLLKLIADDPKEPQVHRASLNILIDLVCAYRELFIRHLPELTYLDKLMREGLLSEDQEVQEAARTLSAHLKRQQG
eukprot:GHVR01091960.1.p1 GENE.GHVR01091960.1~~GHVR01091960.1.p1  ORF type:complete len:465 (+),score=96.48 GHVR01091960.1:340-1734(+)